MRSHDSRLPSYPWLSGHRIWPSGRTSDTLRLNELKKIDSGRIKGVKCLIIGVVIISDDSET